MAYAAVTSLYHTIHLLLTSSCTSVASSTAKILKYARRSTKRLQQTLQKYDKIRNNSEGAMDVDARIRDAARKLEDLIESEASAQFLSQSSQPSVNGSTLSLNLHHLKHDVDCFTETAKKMRAQYMEQLHKPSPPQEVAAAPSTSDNGDMVGLAQLFGKVRDIIISGDHFVAISGMAGIGKTRLVKKLLHDRLVRENFECWALVRVGQEYKFEEILRAIIDQVKDIDSRNTIMERDDNIKEYFERCLRSREYLIVLDDVWDRDIEGDLYRLLHENGCVVVTTRIKGLFGYNEFEMPFLTEEESWELLKVKVFGEEEGDYCPPQLVKLGKKIAQNCEGLPLLILTVSKHLSLVDKNVEYWNEVAEMKNSVFKDACDQIHEILVRSYHFMEQDSKACFLYMGIFPKGYIVQSSRIINLWSAEKFSNERCQYRLDYIASMNLAVIRQKCFNQIYWTKGFNLHIVYRHVSRREGEGSNFMCVLDRYDEDDSIEWIKDMRRLAISHNTLLAIKEVQYSIASVSSLRSVLCTGPYHQYQVPVCLELKLLRVLDVLTIRFYEFPVEVVKLTLLRYLSLTTNANLPPSIHQLYLLEFLIVHQHWRINRSVAESYVPVEIWELQELEHLQIVGRNLPHPPPGTILPKLRNLLDVGVQSCDSSVLKSVPKLDKLRIQIESAPGSAQTSFDHSLCIDKLRSLGSVVMNPVLMPKPMLPPRLLLSMNDLERLSLSGFGYPWEDMSKISELGGLRYLKLKCYAFRGEEWEAKDMRFPWLSHLWIEDTDLVQWTASVETFPCLSSLTMKNCHKLHEIPRFNPRVRVEFDDCNPVAETFVNECTNVFELQVSCSWK